MGQSMSARRIHPAIRDGIAELERLGGDSDEIQQLTIESVMDYARAIDRRSVSHLVSFMRQRSLLHRPVTQLEFHKVYLHHSDGSLEVLRDFLANEDKALVKLDFQFCYFGGREATMKLFDAIQTKASLKDVTININPLIRSHACKALLHFAFACMVYFNCRIWKDSWCILVSLTRRHSAPFNQFFDKTVV
jgi:hypothetical protein